MTILDGNSASRWGKFRNERTQCAEHAQFAGENLAAGDISMFVYIVSTWLVQTSPGPKQADGAS